MATTRLTMAQALVTFLTQQYVTRDGVEQQFFAGCFGIFGHGNISGMGQALQQIPALRYYQARNEQGMVHAATAFAKTANRLQTLACTTSIGPGATNMVTGAATATINRLPVLLLPGDIFARRNVDPVLQQLEWQQSRDMSANDCFKPVSRYWDRINRPDQLPSALLEAMRTLTSPADTGAVTLCLPQDVQTEAFEYNSALFEKRVWHIARIRPDRHAITRAATLIKNAQRPLIIAGGGVIYSDATAALSEFVAATGIPVGETMAGKGSLRYDNPLNLGAIGATGTSSDCALDVVFRHVGAHRLIPGHAQTRVCLGIGTAGASCHGNFTDNFGPKLPALGVLATFSVLDIGPFTVSGHSSLQIVLIMVHFTLATI